MGQEETRANQEALRAFCEGSKKLREITFPRDAECDALRRSLQTELVGRDIECAFASGLWYWVKKSKTYRKVTDKVLTAIFDEWSDAEPMNASSLIREMERRICSTRQSLETLERPPPSTVVVRTLDDPTLIQKFQSYDTKRRDLREKRNIAASRKREILQRVKESEPCVHRWICDANVEPEVKFDSSNADASEDAQATFVLKLTKPSERKISRSMRQIRDHVRTKVDFITDPSREAILRQLREFLGARETVPSRVVLYRKRKRKKS